MKLIFQAYAAYNSTVNQELKALLQDLPVEKITNKTKAYYPCVIDVLTHIFMSDLNWLRRFRAFFTASPVLGAPGILSAEPAVIKAELLPDLKTYFTYRRELDRLITVFVDDVADEEMHMPVKYVNYRGVAEEKELWMVLAHMFNHQTHTRGQLSVLLDEADVFNDFSGFMTRI